MKLRLALVGCGKVAERHLKILKALADEVEVVGVADVNPDRANLFAKELNCKAYTDFRELIKKEDPEVVDLSVPSGLHGKIGIEILKRFKKHILVEKPLALTLSEANKLVELSQKYNLKLVTIFQNRANLPVRLAKKVISEGLLGRIIHLSAKFYWCRTQSYYDSAAWRGTWEQDGGALAQQGCHFADALVYLGGEVESVFAKMGTYLVNIPAEDLLVGIIKFKNGALGTITATTAARPKDIKAEVVVLGERGSIILGGFAMERLEHFAVADSEALKGLNLDEYRENPPHPLGYSHFTYYHSALRYFKNEEREDYLAVGKEALPSLELIVGLYESAERGKEVRFPFKPLRTKLGRKDNAQHTPS